MKNKIVFFLNYTVYEQTKSNFLSSASNVKASMAKQHFSPTSKFHLIKYKSRIDVA